MNNEDYVNSVEDKIGDVLTLISDLRTEIENATREKRPVNRTSMKSDADFVIDAANELQNAVYDDDEEEDVPPCQFCDGLGCVRHPDHGRRMCDI